MLELGQVVLGVRDLEAATRRMEAEGFAVQDGGVHPGLGTANRIIPLGG
ncbi:MAG: VOC family protein, partial [Candidatus Rokuibacteriota bacterium]